MERPRKPGTFRPGDPRAGRHKGIANKATREIRRLAQELLTDPGYLKSLQERLQAGTAGRIEELLYHYAWGKPKEDSTPPQARDAEANVISIEVGPNGHRAV
jgi:hypothetical protein